MRPLCHQINIELAKNGCKAVWVLGFSNPITFHNTQSVGKSILPAPHGTSKETRVMQSWQLCHRPSGVPIDHLDTARARCKYPHGQCLVVATVHTENCERITVRAPDESIFADGMWQHILWVGLFVGALSIGTQAWAYGRDIEYWQTMVFTVLTVSQLFHSLAVRSERESLFTIGVSSNPAMLGAVLLTLALELAIIHQVP